jgi:general secretion pathway protein K
MARFCRQGRTPVRRPRQTVAVLATQLTIDGLLERRRTIGMLSAEQAFQFDMGAEALAADVLVRALQTTPRVTLADAWAQPTVPLPLMSEDGPSAEPIGTLQGALEDMQGRFNLNNLLRVTADGKQDPQPLEQFQRLLASVGLEPKWAAMARDWIDVGNQPGNPDGAKDAVYTSQTPPYRTGNWPMTSPSELMNLPGFGVDRYRKIAPYVTVLPTVTAAVNICTAPSQVLENLAEKLNGEFSGDPEALINARKTGCFPDIPTFTAILRRTAAPQLAGRFADKSSYFRLTARVSLGSTQFTFYSLLFRSPAGKVTPLLRSFGTL